MKLNVLGTEYEIEFREEHTDPKLEINSGYVEPYTKKIIVEKLKPDTMTVESPDLFIKKVLRHEIVHAFLMESGLASNSDWAKNEECVDWIALQFEKIFKAFHETDAI